MTRTGLALPLNLLLPVAGQADVARRAEALGYSTVWAAEAGTNDAFGLLTACAAVTSRVRLATGVLPIFTRTPALMAQSAATLQDYSGGRFALGIGVSSETIVRRWNGVPYDRPLERMREYVPIVRRLLTWEKVSHDSDLYPVDGYRLLLNVPSPPPPILVGALNPGMLRLAGEVSDGALLNWIGAPAVPAALAAVAEGAGGSPRQNAVFVRVCVTPDVEAARAWARREVMGYVIVPAYRRAFGTQGWGTVCADAMALWDSGDRKGAAASLPDEFVDSLCLAGPADEVRARFDEFRAAGVDEPVAFLFSGQREVPAIVAELEATMAALAPGAPDAPDTPDAPA
ncbi:MAG TPA: LLM class F420-dependent oxidoreductase [Frankiaceae bacterium]|nr:LLM class F420-dependent oxidoreductase [Frankiaceae bacterium]